MRILIIGGTGFIGARVTARLASAGHDLTLFHRGQTKPNLPRTVARIHGNRQDLPAFRGEFERLRPEVVIDMIPYTEHDARTVMEVFRGVAQRVVAISSMDVYRAYGRLTRLEPAPPDGALLTEESPLREHLYPYRGQTKGPAHLTYDYEKILVERVVLHDSALSGTVLRLAKVYGPGDPQHHTYEYWKRMNDGRPAILLEEGQAQWRWTRGYVENVAAAIALAAAHEGPGNHVYNVGEDLALAETEWIQSIGQAAGWYGQVKTVPRCLLPVNLALPFDWRHHLAADTSRIRTELGYSEPVARTDALKQTIAWNQSHSPEGGDGRCFDYDAEDAALKQALG